MIRLIVNKQTNTRYQDTEYFYRFPSTETLDESEWEEDE